MSGSPSGDSKTPPKDFKLNCCSKCLVETCGCFHLSEDRYCMTCEDCYRCCQWNHKIAGVIVAVLALWMLAVGVILALTAVSITDEDYRDCLLSCGGLDDKHPNTTALICEDVKSAAGYSANAAVAQIVVATVFAIVSPITAMYHLSGGVTEFTKYADVLTFLGGTAEVGNGILATFRVSLPLLRQPDCVLHGVDSISDVIFLERLALAMVAAGVGMLFLILPCRRGIESCSDKQCATCRTCCEKDEKQRFEKVDCIPCCLCCDIEIEGTSPFERLDCCTAESQAPKTLKGRCKCCTCFGPEVACTCCDEYKSLFCINLIRTFTCCFVERMGDISYRRCSCTRHPNSLCFTLCNLCFCRCCDSTAPPCCGTACAEGCAKCCEPCSVSNQGADRGCTICCESCVVLEPSKNSTYLQVSCCCPTRSDGLRQKALWIIALICISTSVILLVINAQLISSESYELCMICATEHQGSPSTSTLGCMNLNSIDNSIATTATLLAFAAVSIVMTPIVAGLLSGLSTGNDDLIHGKPIQQITLKELSDLSEIRVLRAVKDHNIMKHVTVEGIQRFHRVITPFLQAFLAQYPRLKNDSTTNSMAGGIPPKESSVDKQGEDQAPKDGISEEGVTEEPSLSEANLSQSDARQAGESNNGAGEASPSRVSEGNSSINGKAGEHPVLTIGDEVGDVNNAEPGVHSTTITPSNATAQPNGHAKQDHKESEPPGKPNEGPEGKEQQAESKEEHKGKELQEEAEVKARKTAVQVFQNQLLSPGSPLFAHFIAEYLSVIFAKRGCFPQPIPKEKAATKDQPPPANKPTATAPSAPSSPSVSPSSASPSPSSSSPDPSNGTDDNSSERKDGEKQNNLTLSEPPLPPSKSSPTGTADPASNSASGYIRSNALSQDSPQDSNGMGKKHDPLRSFQTPTLDNGAYIAAFSWEYYCHKALRMYMSTILVRITKHVEDVSRATEQAKAVTCSDKKENRNPMTRSWDISQRKLVKLFQNAASRLHDLPIVMPRQHEVEKINKGEYNPDEGERLAFVKELSTWDMEELTTIKYTKEGVKKVYENTKLALKKKFRKAFEMAYFLTHSDAEDLVDKLFHVNFYNETQPLLEATNCDSGLATEKEIARDMDQDVDQKATQEEKQVHDDTNKKSLDPPVNPNNSNSSDGTDDSNVGSSPTPSQQASPSQQSSSSRPSRDPLLDCVFDTPKLLNEIRDLATIDGYTVATSVNRLLNITKTRIEDWISDRLEKAKKEFEEQVHVDTVDDDSDDLCSSLQHKHARGPSFVNLQEPFIGKPSTVITIIDKATIPDKPPAQLIAVLVAIVLDQVSQALLELRGLGYLRAVHPYMEKLRIGILQELLTHAHPLTSLLQDAEKAAGPVRAAVKSVLPPIVLDPDSYGPEVDPTYVPQNPTLFGMLLRYRKVVAFLPGGSGLVNSLVSIIILLTPFLKISLYDNDICLSRIPKYGEIKALTFIVLGLMSFGWFLILSITAFGFIVATFADRTVTPERDTVLVGWKVRLKEVYPNDPTEVHQRYFTTIKDMLRPG